MLARPLGGVVWQNLLMSQHRAQLRYAAVHSGGHLSPTLRLQPGAFGYLRTTQPTGLSLPAQPVVLQVVQDGHEELVTVRGCSSKHRALLPAGDVPPDPQSAAMAVPQPPAGDAASLQELVEGWLQYESPAARAGPGGGSEAGLPRRDLLCRLGLPVLASPAPWDGSGLADVSTCLQLLIEFACM